MQTVSYSIKLKLAFLNTVLLGGLLSALIMGVCTAIATDNDEFAFITISLIFLWFLMQQDESETETDETPGDQNASANAHANQTVRSIQQACDVRNTVRHELQTQCTALIKHERLLTLTGCALIVMGLTRMLNPANKLRQR